jgi:hypothetical protein
LNNRAPMKSMNLRKRHFDTPIRDVVEVWSPKSEVWRYLSLSVVSPRKVSRFAPINHYYIIIDEVFFDNFLVLFIYQLYAKKKVIIHSFWSTLIIYVLVVYKKIMILSFWSTFVKDLKRTFLAKFTKNHTRTVKSQKVGFFLYQRKSAWND